MGRGSKEQGLFAVHLRMSADSIYAELTGDHYRSDEKEKAFQYVQGVSFSSPAYLVSDGVVDLALRAYRQAPRRGLSECHEGRRGKSCGECPECLKARRKAFTQVILGHVEYPSGPLQERLQKAVHSVIGMTWMDDSWSEGMTEEEVQKVFDEIGSMKKERENNETHQDEA